MLRNHRIRAAVVLAGIVAALFATPSTSLFTGFDGNPASSATDAVTFDENPATDATDAIPQDMRKQPYVRHRSTVAANASTNATGDVEQHTATAVNDHLRYRPGRSFDNVFVRQEARSNVRQRCRTDGSCRQDAQSDINQSADIPIKSRFTNVFVTQDAATRFDQHCRARGTCEQTADSRFNQDTDFSGSHWSSNGFVTRRQTEHLDRSATDR